MLSNVSFSDYINDSIRILFIADAFKEKKSHKLSDTKIRLYDYYLKFPKTMFEKADIEKDYKNNLDEYYAFFHWQPDIIRYRRNIYFLIAKGLLIKTVDGGSVQYAITSEGTALLSELKSPQTCRVSKLLPLITNNISKLSDSKIEEEIRSKANVYKRLLEED